MIFTNKFTCYIANFSDPDTSPGRFLCERNAHTLTPDPLIVWRENIEHAIFIAIGGRTEYRLKPCFPGNRPIIEQLHLIITPRPCPIFQLPKAGGDKLSIFRNDLPLGVGCKDALVMRSLVNGNKAISRAVNAGGCCPSDIDMHICAKSA
jgi:hypothetical protein